MIQGIPIVWLKIAMAMRSYFSTSLAKKGNQRNAQDGYVLACRRSDRFVCTKDSYIGSLHFVGENGPTDENPDPISATASRRSATAREVEKYDRIAMAIFNHTIGIP